MQRRISALWISMALLLVTGSAFAQEEGDVGAAETTDVVAEDTSADTSAVPAEDGTDDIGGDAASVARPISVGLLLGFGLDLGGSQINPFGLGFGVRGGYNLDKIYLGARFMFFLGGSEDVAGAEASFNVMTIGVEGGYDFVFDKLTVRPEVGLGLAVGSGESTFTIIPGMTSTVDSSSTDLYIAPGVSVLYDITDSIFIGGNLSIPIIFVSGGSQGLEILANGGMRF